MRGFSYIYMRSFPFQNLFFDRNIETKSARNDWWSKPNRPLFSPPPNPGGALDLAEKLKAIQNLKFLRLNVRVREITFTDGNFPDRFKVWDTADAFIPFNDLTYGDRLTLEGDLMYYKCIRGLWAKNSRDLYQPEFSPGYA